MIRSTISKKQDDVRYLLLAFLPPLLVGVFFGCGWAVDYQASARVERMAAELLPESRPSLRVVDNYSYSDHPYNAIGADDEKLWPRLSLAAAEINDRIDHFTRSFDGSQPDSFFTPADDWPAASVLEQILADEAPIIQEIADAANGLDDGTIDLEVPIMRLLMHRLRLAFYRQDHATTLETLQWSYRITQQSDQSSHQAKLALRTLYGGINETLAFGFWQTPELVQQLHDLVDKPLPIKSDGLQILRESRPDALATIDRDRRGQAAFGSGDIHTPSRFHLYLLRDLERIEQSWETNPMAILQDLRTRDDQPGDWSYLTAVGIPHADLRRYNSFGSVWGARNKLGNLAETEYQRWITATLVAIKKFQLETGVWPQSTTELFRVGRSTSSYPDIERTLQLLPASDDDRAVLKRPRSLALAIDPKLGKLMRSGVHIGWFDEDIVQ